MRLPIWLSTLMLAAGAGLFSAAALPAPAQKQGGTLRLSLFRDVDSLDPALGYGTESWMVEFATCAKLYNYPDKPGRGGTQVIPEVATSFPKVSKDGKTQTIELRRTFRFDTGARITAPNFVAAFNRDADPKTGSPIVGVGYLNDIEGWQAVIDNKASAISGVRPIGPYTLQIRTTRPVYDLPARLTMPFFCPIATNTPPQEIDDPLGSGPYYVESRVPNRQIVLKRNRFYRGSRPSNVDRVVLTVGVDQEECRQQVEANAQDYCEFVTPTAARGLAARYGINKGRLFFAPALETNYFAFNHDRQAFKGEGQIPLEQAINWAIDRHALAATRGFLGATRTNHILPPGMSRAASIYPLGGITEASLAKARALRAKARFKPEKLVLYTSASAFGTAVAQIFRFNMSRLGIDVDVKYFPLFTLVEKTGTRGEPFDVAFGTWNVDYADPVSFFATLDGNNIAATGNSNIAYFDRPRYNREIERIERLEGEARRKAWAELDAEMMRDDPPWAPYLNFATLEFVSKSFGCYVEQPVIAKLDIAAACKK